MDDGIDIWGKFIDYMLKAKTDLLYQYGLPSIPVQRYLNGLSDPVAFTGGYTKNQTRQDDPKYFGRSRGDLEQYRTIRDYPEDPGRI